MKLREEDTRTVACRLCGAPVGHWCSLSRSRRTGGQIPPGDWRAAHAVRQRDALRKIVDDHRRQS